ncbi:hypothetical protein THAOC_36407, partial [Thalassiosira oceanica]
MSLSPQVLLTNDPREDSQENPQGNSSSDVDIFFSGTSDDDDDDSDYVDDEDDGDNVDNDGDKRENVYPTDVDRPAIEATSSTDTLDVHGYLAPGSQENAVPQLAENRRDDGSTSTATLGCSLDDLPNVPDEMEHLEDILPDISWLDEFGPDSDSGQAGDDCQSQCESRVANNLNIGDCPPSMFGLSGRGPNKRKTAPNSEKKKRQRKRSRGDDPPFSFTVKRPDDDGKGGGCPESTRPRRSHRLKELNSRRATSSKKAVHATDHHGGGRNR